MTLPVGSGADGNDYLKETSYDAESGVLTFTMSNGQTWSETLVDNHATDLTLDENNVLTITMKNGNTLTQDLSSLAGLGTKYDIQLNGQELSLIDLATGEPVNTVTLPVGSGADGNDYLASTAYDAATGVLTLTMSNGTEFTHTLIDNMLTNAYYNEDGNLVLVRNNNLDDIVVETPQKDSPQRDLKCVDGTCTYYDVDGSVRETFVIPTPVEPGEDNNTKVTNFVYDNGQLCIHQDDGSDPICENIPAGNTDPVTGHAHIYGIFDAGVTEPALTANKGDFFIEQKMLGDTLVQCREWENMDGTSEGWLDRGVINSSCYDGGVIVAPTEMECSLELVRSSQVPSGLTFPYIAPKKISNNGGYVYKTQAWNAYSASEKAYGVQSQGFSATDKVSPNGTQYNDYTKTFYNKNVQLYFGFKLKGEDCENLANDLASGNVVVKNANLKLPIAKYQDEAPDDTELVAVLNDNHRAYSGVSYGSSRENKGNNFAKAKNPKFFNNGIEATNDDLYQALEAGKQAGGTSKSSLYLAPNASFDFANLFGYSDLTSVLSDMAATDSTIHMVVADDIIFLAPPSLDITFEKL